MHDPNQIDVPPSFLALFTSPSGHRLLEPMQIVRERYELCEDLAQMLVEQAGTIAFKSSGSETQVLASIEQGLSSGDTPLDAREAQWTVTRLAELLGWRVA